MKIEEQIFSTYKVNVNKLLEYGFEQFKDVFTYSKNFRNNEFKALITIDGSGIVDGKIIENAFEEEFTLFRVENYKGSFAAEIKEAYTDILLDIREHCFYKEAFISNQANRVAKYIFDKFKESPDHPFNTEKYKNLSVYRNTNNTKWYGLVMPIARKLLGDSDSEDIVEVLNLKINEDNRDEILKIDGIYPSYHMNKQKWISVTLDDRVSDDILFNLVDISRELVGSKNKRKNSGGPSYWIQPCNPTYYDIDHAFKRDKGVTIWKQSRNVNIGDICYMYVANPVGAVKYKCEIVEKDIPYEYQDETVKMTHVMKVKMINKISHKKITFKFLKSIGVPLIRGPVLINEEISKKIDEMI